MQFKKVTLTVPARLYNKCSELIDEGYFANFSELVRAGIRAQLELDLFSKRQDNWFERLATMSMPQEKSDEEIIADLRKTRDEVWREKYANRFG